MRKLLYLCMIVTVVVFIYMRIDTVKSLSEQDAKGVEQFYKENGIPVETGKVEKGVFLKYCRVNARIQGAKQTEISTPVEARILNVHRQVGEVVKADEVIISLDKEDPRSSTQYRQLKAVYETTLKNYKRMLELRETGAVSQSKLDEVKMKLDVDRANLESAIKTVSLSSTMDGVILDMNAREGELISPMKTVATIARVDRVRLLAEVSEADILCIRPGQNVIVNGRQGHDISRGKVTKVSLNADTKTGLFRVEMEADNRDWSLKIGTYTTARIEVINDADSVYAELRGIQQEPDGSYYVYVVKGGRALKTPIEISGMNDDYVRIAKGVDPEDMIVVRGFARLVDNAKVLF